MRIGLVADAHGNPAGLDACLAALESAAVERVWFLGDAVGYFPDGDKVLQSLDAAACVCIQGNHDAMLLGTLPLDVSRDSVYRLAEARRTLLPSHLAQVRGWPTRRLEVLGERRALMVHGNPGDELCGYVYPDASLDPFADLPVDILFLAHTHRPFVRKAGSVIVVNVGSSGLPRDQGNLASCAVYDSVSGDCEILRVPLDVTSLCRRYAARVHESVLDCLLRTSQQGVVGRIVGVGA